jgi:hypothetical protein
MSFSYREALVSLRPGVGPGGHTVSDEMLETIAPCPCCGLER